MMGLYTSALRAPQALVRARNFRRKVAEEKKKKEEEAREWRAAQLREEERRRRAEEKLQKMMQEKELRLYVVKLQAFWRGKMARRRCAELRERERRRLEMLRRRERQQEVNALNLRLYKLEMQQRQRAARKIQAWMGFVQAAGVEVFRCMFQNRWRRAGWHNVSATGRPPCRQGAWRVNRAQLELSELKKEKEEKV